MSDEELLEKLAGLGVDVQKGMTGSGEQEFFARLQGFLTGVDFLRLGQSVGRGRWQSAVMAVGRLDREAERLGADCFRRWFAGLKAAAARRDEREAKQILMLVTQRRTRLRELLREEKDKDGKSLRTVRV